MARRRPRAGLGPLEQPISPALDVAPTRDRSRTPTSTGRARAAGSPPGSAARSSPSLRIEHRPSDPLGRYRDLAALGRFETMLQRALIVPGGAVWLPLCQRLDGSRAIGDQAHLAPGDGERDADHESPPS